MGFTGLCACSFCRNCMESREHLFFECPFTKIIWGHVIGLCLVADIPVSWEEILKWGIANLKGRGFRAILWKVVWRDSIYHIWIQGTVGVMEKIA